MPHNVTTDERLVRLAYHIGKAQALVKHIPNLDEPTREILKSLLSCIDIEQQFLVETLQQVAALIEKSNVQPSQE